MTRRAALVVAALLFASVASAATFTVTNTGDSGVGSLRQAVLDANATAGADTIQFAISGTPSITLSSGLTVNGDLTIDGRSQSGFAGTPIMVISGGGSAIDLFTITGSNVTIRGLVMNGARTAIVLDPIANASNLTFAGNYFGVAADGVTRVALSGSGIDYTSPVFTITGLRIGGSSTIDRNVMAAAQGAVTLFGIATTGLDIKGNYIGVGADGTTPLPSSLDQLAPWNASGIIGGPAAGDRNVIAAATSAFGIRIDNSPLTIQGNLIGTNAAGTAAIANRGGIGISNSSTVTIGGSAAGEGNVISGNIRYAISANGSRMVIKGNRIGTDITGTTGIPNGLGGINNSSATGVVIGGTTAGDRNIISANGGNAITDSSSASPGPLIQGNLIGVNASMAPMPNAGAGISLGNSPRNATIGGTAAGAGNVIANNIGAGVVISGASATGQSILSNSIYANGGLGIDLGGDGVTANDPGDTDSGANHLQNAPLLASAISSGASTAISGTLNSAASSTFRIELFSNASADASGHGEGQTLLTGFNVTTDASGNAAFSVSVPVLATGTAVTATATASSLNDTSEFSNAVFAGTHGALQLSASSYSVGESSGSATITVQRSGGSYGIVTVDYSTANGTATAGSDYTGSSGTVVFNQGETTKTFTVPIANDTTDENDETFSVMLANVTGGATLSTPSTATVTITDDDAAPSLSADNVTVSEGNSGTTTATFTVTLSASSGKVVTVDYATGDQTATASTDYASRSGQLQFNPGETTKSVSVLVNGDTVVEPNETFTLNLLNPANAIVAGQGVGTIANDDGVPQIIINDVAVIEGNSGTSDAIVTLTLSAASSSAATVNWATADDTATAGADYETSSGSVTFNAGETSKTISIPVIGDTLVEPSERFLVNLSASGGASIPDPQGSVTIADDDGSPVVSINDVAMAEGSGGATSFVFTVTLAPAAATTVTVSYTTADATADGGDYAAASGSLTFSPGETTKSIAVAVSGDAMVEPNETFTVNLSGAGGATIGDAQGVGTIINDDGPPRISAANVTLTEGTGSGSTALFTVTLSDSSTSAVTLNYATADGTASAGADYTAVNGSLTFNPGETTKSVAVNVVGDVLVEFDETFVLNLGGAAGGIITTPQATATILDDDSEPTLSINDVTRSEGSAGTTNFIFTVTLTGSTARTVTVDYATQDGSASAGTDYAAAGGTLTFAPGATTQSVQVAVAGDSVVEPDETFLVNLSAAMNATIARAQGTGTITNDDAPAVVPSISINDVAQSEGNAGATTFTFAVTLSQPTTSFVMVHYATADGAATAGSDYASASGTLTFSPGTTSQMIQVAVAGDTVIESDETFVVNLSAPVNATIERSQATGTISNDDAAAGVPLASIADMRTPEGNSGRSNAAFIVTLSAPAATTVTISYSTANGTASAGSDYTATSGVVTFAAGTTTSILVVPIVGDVAVERDETFAVNIGSATNATIGRARAIGTIINDDLPATPPPPPELPSLIISDTSIVEGDAGRRNATVTVMLSFASAQAVSVRYTTIAQTATAGADFDAVQGLLIIPAGETTATVEVPVIGDGVAEGDETFVVRFYDAAVPLTRADALVTIVDDDAPAPTRMILVVAGSIAGAEGSQFRTSLQLLNASDKPFSGTLLFHPMNALDAAGDVSLPLSLAPGQMRFMADVVREIGASGIGTVDLRSSSGELPVATLRVFNDGGAAGTSGFVLAPLLPSDALSAGAHAALTGPSDPIASRFNVGVRALDDGATMTIAVHAASGEVLKLSTRSYGPNFFTQSSAADFAGISIGPNEYITIEITAGRAFIYGSWIDNVTNDPSVQLARRY